MVVNKDKTKANKAKVGKEEKSTDESVIILRKRVIFRRLYIDQSSKKN